MQQLILQFKSDSSQSPTYLLNEDTLKIGEHNFIRLIYLLRKLRIYSISLSFLSDGQVTIQWR